MISFLLAMDEHRLIGKDNDLPWYLPADLQYFKKVTMGKTVVMGRKTHESIGKPLPGRTNVILTRNHDYEAPGCQVIHSLDELPLSEEEVFVIGGAEIFKALLPMADRLYVTQIHAAFEGETFFPEIEEKEWKLISSEKGTVDEKNRYEHDFLVYERRRNAKGLLGSQ